MTFRIAVANDALLLRESVEIGDDGIAVYLRAELGVRPDHETVHLTGEVGSTVATWRVDRAQEGTVAAAWPIGSPLALLAAGSEPDGEVTVHLAHPLAADAYEVDMQGCYRRLRVGSEIMWDASVFGDPQETPDSQRTSYRHTVQRAREGTVAVAHAAGATVTALRPGES